MEAAAGGSRLESEPARGCAAAFFFLRAPADRCGLDSRKPSLLRIDSCEPDLCLLVVVVASEIADAHEADREWTADGEGLALSSSDSGGGE